MNYINSVPTNNYCKRCESLLNSNGVRNGEKPVEGGTYNMVIDCISCNSESADKYARLYLTQKVELDQRLKDLYKEINDKQMLINKIIGELQELATENAKREYQSSNEGHSLKLLFLYLKNTQTKKFDINDVKKYDDQLKKY